MSRRKGPGLVIWGISILFIAFVVASFNFMGVEKQLHAPETLENIPLLKQASGDEVIGYVQQIAGKKVDILRGVKGVYDGNNQKATLQLLVVKNHKAASQLVNNLATGMEMSGKFNKAQFLDGLGNRGFYTFGENADQYVFTRENLVYWLSIEKGNSQELLDWVYRHEFRKGNY